MPDWLLHFPETVSINIQDPINNAIDYILINWEAFFDGFTNVLLAMLRYVGTGHQCHSLVGDDPFGLYPHRPNDQKSIPRDILFAFIVFHRRSRPLVADVMKR